MATMNDEAVRLWGRGILEALARARQRFAEENGQEPSGDYDRGYLVSALREAAGIRTDDTVRVGADLLAPVHAPVEAA